MVVHEGSDQNNFGAEDYNMSIFILYAGFSESNLKAEGYKSTDDYFMGRSTFNESVFGWRGIKVAWGGSTNLQMF